MDPYGSKDCRRGNTLLWKLLRIIPARGREYAGTAPVHHTLRSIRCFSIADADDRPLWVISDASPFVHQISENMRMLCDGWRCLPFMATAAVRLKSDFCFRLHLWGFISWMHLGAVAVLSVGSESYLLQDAKEPRWCQKPADHRLHILRAIPVQMKLVSKGVTLVPLPHATDPGPAAHDNACIP